MAKAQRKTRGSNRALSRVSVQGSGRVEGWEQRWSQAVRKYSASPFAWGVSDCFTLCADTVEAILGEDRFVKLRKPYFSQKEGLKVLVGLKAKDIGDVFAQVFEEIPPSLAQRGDIGRARYPGAEMGGGVVFVGSYVVGQGERGLVRLPISSVERAFRVA